MDHEKMTYLFDGFDQRLTGVKGHVVDELVA
jgi:hypothetical protein